MSKIPMLEKFAAQSLVEHDGELIFSKEKFAELIVRECVELLHQRRKPIHGDPIYGQGWVDGRVSGVDLIEKHFGVEE